MNCGVLRELRVMDTCRGTDGVDTQSFAPTGKWTMTRTSWVDPYQTQGVGYCGEGVWLASLCLGVYYDEEGSFFCMKLCNCVNVGLGDGFLLAKAKC